MVSVKKYIYLLKISVFSPRGIYEILYFKTHVRIVGSSCFFVPPSNPYALYTAGTFSLICKLIGKKKLMHAAGWSVFRLREGE